MEEEKETRKYYKIGDVSKMLGVPASTLRFWEKEFKQLKPMKNKKGDRIYHLKDIDILKEIHYLTHEKGIKLSKASKKVKSGTLAESPNTELLKRLRDLREKLVQLKNSLD
jgi:DNA-binding transcriptional MerR regulator